MSDEMSVRESAEDSCSEHFLFPSVLSTQNYTATHDTVNDFGQVNILSGFSSFKVEPSKKENNLLQSADEDCRKSTFESKDTVEFEAYESKDSSESDEYYQESRRKKRKKKQKKEHKKKKQKKKSRILYDTSKPDTIWLDDTNLKLYDAFREDRREDRDNVQFDTLYRLDVANYKRKNGIVCLGMRCNQHIEWNDGRDKKKKPRNRPLNSRYFNTKMSPNGDDWNVVDLDIKQLSKSMDEIEHLNDSKSNTFPHGDKKMEGDVEESSTDNFSQKTEFFNEHLRKNPHDVTHWIEFARLQDESFANLDEYLISSTFELEKYPAGKQRAVTEKKINILEKALSMNRDSVELILEYMEYCREILDPVEVNKKWTKFTFNNPQKGQLWLNFLIYVQSDFPHFSVSKVLESYGKCFKMMSDISEGAIKTHKPDSNHLEIMLAIFVQYCLFLYLSDLPEKSIAAMQALIEFNCFVPLDIERLPVSSQKSFFEAFWDSDVPRFGEQGAKGWNNWMLLQGGSTENMDSTPKYEITNIPIAFGSDSTLNVEAIDLTLKKPTNWLNIERRREKCQWKPERQVTSEGDIEDPDRIVLADDILPCLFKLKSERNIQSLLLLHLSFLGIPILKDLFSEFLCERIIQMGVLNVRMKLFAIRDTDEFVCFNRTADLKLDQYNIEMSDDRICYIDDVFAQSLRLANNYSDNFTNVISQCWLLFKVVLLKMKTTGIHSQQMKTAVKGVRKFAKSLMRLDPNRNNLELWQIFAYFEYDFGRHEEAFRVFDMIISMCVEERDNGIVFNKSAAIYRSYVSFLMNASCQDVDHRDGLENKIIHALILLSGESSLSLNTYAATAKVNPLRLRRVKESYKERFTRLIDEHLVHHEEALFDKSKYSSEQNVEWVLCFALFMYFVEGLNSAENVLREFQENIALTYSQTLKVSKLVLDIHTFRHSKQHLTVADLRNELWSAVRKFPEEPIFMEALLKSEKAGLASLKIRRFHHMNIRKAKSLLSWMFAIHYEEERLKKLETWINVESIDSHMKLQDNVITTLPNTGIVNRLRGLYNRATASREGRYCVALWRKFLIFEAKYGDARRTKNAFYAALQNCPWSKDLYTDAIELIGESFDDVIDIMHEKEVRVRLPTEELDIMLEEAN